MQHLHIVCVLLTNTDFVKQCFMSYSSKQQAFLLTTQLHQSLLASVSLSTGRSFVFQIQNLDSFLINQTEKYEGTGIPSPFDLTFRQQQQKTIKKKSLKRSLRHRLSPNTFIFMLLRNCRIKIPLAPCCRIALRPRGLITHVKGRYWSDQRC